jgi:hypothetical protein
LLAETYLRAPRKTTRTTKTGAPRAAVTTPTGSSCRIDTSLPMASHNDKSAAPVSIEPGSTVRW